MLGAAIAAIGVIVGAVGIVKSARMSRQIRRIEAFESERQGAIEQMRWATAHAHRLCREGSVEALRAVGYAEGMRYMAALLGIPLARLPLVRGHDQDAPRHSVNL